VDQLFDLSFELIEIEIGHVCPDTLCLNRLQANIESAQVRVNGGEAMV
jgi:hypothetical protein